jgi:hypothetical protein
MNGGGKSTTTQTTNSAPWSGAQPALQQSIGAAQSLFNSGTGAQPYYGSTVVPWSTESQDAMTMLKKGAYNNGGTSGLSGQLQGVIDTGGYNSAQLNALNNTRDVANSTFDINSDPGFQQVVDLARNNVNVGASAAGRYGGGMRDQNIVNTVGDLGARQYQAFQQRKDAANSNLFNMGQTAFGNLNTAYSGLQAPAQDLMKVGAMNEDYATRQLNDKLRMWNEEQNLPWQNLSRLNAIASGAGQLGGTQTTAQPGQNPWLQAAGYGLTGAGLLGGLF